MDIDEIETKIIEEVEAESGFMMQLRVHNTFDEQALTTLLKTIEEYNRLLGNSKYINRDVVFMLTSTLEIIRGIENRFDAMSDPRKKQVSNAIRKLSRDMDYLLDLRSRPKNL